MEGKKLIRTVITIGLFIALITVIIVSQKVSSIMNADRVIVLDNGRVAGIGRHKDLILNCEVYQDIVASQFKREEAQ